MVVILWGDSHHIQRNHYVLHKFLSLPITSTFLVFGGWCSGVCLNPSVVSLSGTSICIKSDIAALVAGLSVIGWAVL